MSIISGPRENSLGGAISPHQIVAKSGSFGILAMCLDAGGFSLSCFSPPAKNLKRFLKIDSF